MIKITTRLYPALIAGLSLLPLAAGAQDISSILTRVGGTMNTIIGLLFIAATLVFLWGVVMFIAGSADPAKRDKAKGIMTWGIIGLAVMAAAWGITTILIAYFLPGGGTPPGFVPPPGGGGVSDCLRLGIC